MPPLVWPEIPQFKSEAERTLFDALLNLLSDSDALLANLRLTDPQGGDCEIDLVALIDGVGCIVFENKGGRITYDGQKWIQSDKTGSRTIDPHGQILRNQAALRNFLRSHWRYGNIKSEWLLAFPQYLIPNVQDPGVPRERIIDKSEIQKVLSRSISVLSKNANRRINREPDWVESAFEALKGHDLKESDRDSFLHSAHEFVRHQTHEMKELIELLADNNRIYVQGPAGSGKTWLAFEQAVKWSQEGLKVGVMVFNRGLNSYLQKKKKEVESGKSPAWIGTFHKFVADLGMPSGFVSSDSAVAHEEEMIALGKLQTWTDEQKFDAWVVDEAQDFHDSWWRILSSSLKDPINGKLAVFGDSEQQVFGKRGSPEGYFAKIRLKANLRNCLQIGETVQHLVNPGLMVRGPLGYEVAYIEVPDYDSVIPAADDAISKLVDEELWDLGEIALLTTLHQHPVHKENLVEGKENYWDLLWNGEDVFYSTVGGFKGLERSAIVLAIDGFHEQETKKDVLYVGMTRARDRLIVVGTKGDLDLIRHQELSSEERV